ncbi:class F sortase [Streptomyces beijiangensis]|uniref:Class F sortase n=1 Tax=Streptomyces beijiangensis TaxID=163361 RepID=A0A939FDB8_9ACTN|nr:class F sortase [Streptomyces beijiangensis]MBO0516024.1 class F sortase [Streptomyces beijiangensis]
MNPDDRASPGRRTSTAGRHARLAVLAAAPVLAVAGALLLALGISHQEPAPPGVSSPTASTSPTGRPPQRATSTAVPSRPLLMPASAPSRLTIPSLGVSTSLERLGMDAKQAMQTPRDPAKAGWYQLGPTPGEQGPAVIAGHVTWNGAQAVFFRLAQLKPGQRIDVARADGTTAHFTVTKTAQYAKDRFPSIEVYRNLDYAGLRLITCGGTYTQADHHYRDNIVVYAQLASPAG